MIVKLIPETFEEKRNQPEKEFRGVSNYFICGVCKDEESQNIDFHQWDGQYEKLIGPLFYFANFLLNEQNVKNNRSNVPNVPKFAQNAPKISKRGMPEDGLTGGFIKRGAPEDGFTAQIIDTDGSETVDVENVLKIENSVDQEDVQEDVQENVQENVQEDVQENVQENVIEAKVETEEKEDGEK